MSDRKTGDVIGCIPRSMLKQFLNYEIRRAAAWRQIEALSKEEIKLFGELDRTFDLRDWTYSIDNRTGKIILERHKTMQELELTKVERELIENGEGEVAK